MNRWNITWAWGACALLCLAGCPGVPVVDAGARDAGAQDAGAQDAGAQDAGESPRDASAPDVDPGADAGDALDAGLPDVVNGVDAGPACEFPSTVHDDDYTGVADLQDGALTAALHSFVSDNAVGFGYDAARNLMYGITGDIDVDENNLITCAYTGIQVPADGTRSPGLGDEEITTEHSWPRSDGAENFPAEGDLHHLFPAVSPANGARGNHEFGAVTCSGNSCDWAGGGSALGPAADGRPDDVFSVRLAMRGDIARAHFYFSVRYELSIPPDEEVTLRAWHCQDPPSDAERLRNDSIEAEQQNRNPFVDQPQLVHQVADF